MQGHQSIAVDNYGEYNKIGLEVSFIHWFFYLFIFF